MIKMYECPPLPGSISFKLAYLFQPIKISLNYDHIFGQEFLLSYINIYEWSYKSENLEIVVKASLSIIDNESMVVNLISYQSQYDSLIFEAAENREMFKVRSNCLCPCELPVIRCVYG